MLPGLVEAVEIILGQVRRLDVIESPLLSCTGQAASENVYADYDLPRSAIAGRDGYAVKSQDIRGASYDHPATFRIIARTRAGRPTKRMLKPGTAIRIMSGSPIPSGADCVVRFEDTNEPTGKTGLPKDNPSEVKIFVPLLPGDNVWGSGSHVRESNLLLQKGCVIGPAQICALASFGKTRARVIRRPRVAIIDTGDELVKPGEKLGYGKIYSGNSLAVAALVSHCGGVPKILGIARDREDSLLSKIQKAMMADAVITIGGVSKGDYDLVLHTLGKVGKILFPKIRMIPGGAAFSILDQLSGHNGQTAVPVFSLPGPPTGCLISFETLVRPALLKMLGFTDVAHPMVEATALDEFRPERPVDFATFTFLKTRTVGHEVRFNMAEGRSKQASMMAANSLTIVPGGTVVKAGDRIQSLFLDWRRDQLLI